MQSFVVCCDKKIRKNVPQNTPPLTKRNRFAFNALIFNKLI